MSPSIVLGLLLGSLYGLLWHACLGRRPLWLPIYWAVGVVGFFVGYALAALAGLHLIALGAIPLVEATVGAVLALALTWGLFGRRAHRALPDTG